MSWKDLVGSPITSIAGLGICVSFLADVQGAATAVRELWPFLKAFAPFIVIGLAIVCVCRLLASLFLYLRARTPSEKFRQQYLTLVSCRNAVSSVLDGELRHRVNLHSDLTNIRHDLIALDIECPDIATFNREHLQLWYTFLNNLVPLARHKQLKEARIFYQQIRP